MGIVPAFTTGLRRATAEPKLVFVLYLINLLLALPLALTFRGALGEGFGNSLAPGETIEGLSAGLFQEFMSAHGGGVWAVLDQVGLLMIVSMFLQAFLAGGILTLIQQETKRSSLSAFFGGCGTYFFRFFRLFLLFGIALVLVAFVVGGLVFALASSLTQNSTSEVTDFWFRVGALVVTLVPIIIVRMISDYAKIYVVVEDERSMLRSAWRSVKFVLRNFLRTLSLEVLMLLIAVVLFAVYLWLDLSVGMTTDFTILLMFVIQQLFMVSRAWTKVFFFAGEMTMYRSIRAADMSDARNEVAIPTVERA
jgi:hypothetical protein